MNNGNSFWATQNAVAMNGLIEDASQLAGALRNRNAAKREEANFRAGYVKALAQAKITGVMPDEYQEHVPVDQLARQVGIKAVALRELAKLNSRHPLVESAQFRSNIATKTLLNYNQAERPQGGNVDLNAFAPDDLQTKEVLNATFPRQ